MLTGVYSPYDFRVKNAKGINIYTDSGDFLDTYSGIGVMAFGHSHPEVIAAIKGKVERYTHLSNYFLDEDASAVAGLLLSMTGSDGEVYFSNSGTEANEAALKAIKKCRKGKIISFSGNFHGRTLGSLSITYSSKLRKPFEPLISDTVFLPLDEAIFRDYVSENQVAGVFLECIQGNTGVFPIPEELVKAVEELREEYGYLVVADEIQAGLGRTGEFFSYKHFGLKPDIVTVGKAVGGGLPLGGTIFIGFSPFDKGDHGSTFAPNPVALAAGKAVLSRIDEDLLEEVREKGEYFSKKLLELSWVKEIRGKGLMIGAGAEDPVKIKEGAFKNGVLLNLTNGGIRFLPALNIKIEEIDEIISRLDF